MRYKLNRRDANESEIFKYVQASDAGYDIVPAIRQPYDAHVFHSLVGFLAFLECKTKLGALTPAQVGFKAKCRGRSYVVAYTPEEALKGLEAELLKIIEHPQGCS